METTNPYQRRKPTQKPTIHWNIQVFEGLDILLKWRNGQVTLRHILNLRPANSR
jgi:hypothetical protein